MKRLLILACSSSKLDQPAPALLLYQGPLFLVTRKWFAAAGPLKVLILSAKHGLIDAQQKLAPYDQRMDHRRARELAPQVLAMLGDVGKQHGPFDECYVELGRDYQAALPPREELARILGCPRVIYDQGAIGLRCQALKAWLRVQ